MSNNPFDDSYREPPPPPAPQRPQMNKMSSFAASAYQSSKVPLPTPNSTVQDGIASPGMSTFARSARSIASSMSEEEEVALALAMSKSETETSFTSMLPAGMSKVVTESPGTITQAPPLPLQSVVEPPKPLSAQVVLHLSARGIPKLDTFSKSDPQVILYLPIFRNNMWEWQEVGRTEFIMNCHEPVFQRTFVMDYVPSIEQKLRFLVLDIDEPNSLAIEKQDIIGQVVTNLGYILHEPNMEVTLPIVHDKPKRGVLTIRATIGQQPPVPIRASTAPVNAAPPPVDNRRGQLKSYNSIDEYSQFSAAAFQDYRKKDAEFDVACQKKGWQVKRMGEDGNCFFRSIADQIYGNQDRHAEVRTYTLNFLQAHRDLFQDFILEDFDQYVARKRQLTTYANNVEIQACACAYGRRICVYKYDVSEPFADVVPFLEDERNPVPADQRAPLMISYHRSNHYNSLITPYYHK